MSKFLKFIVALILIVFIGAGAALIIPPFLGVDAVVVQEGMETNQRVGTAIYAKEKDVSSLAAGTQILTQDNNSAYIRKVAEYDNETGFAVTEDNQMLFFSSTYRRAYFAIPFIGYLTIATQSREGLIILLLILAVTVILFIISEILRKSKKKDELVEEEDDDEYFRGLAKGRENARDAVGVYTIGETGEGYSESPAALADAEESPAEEAQFRDIFQEQSTISLEGSAEAPDIFDGAARADAREIPETEEPYEELPEAEHSVGDDSLPDVQAALEAALENQQMGRTEAISLPPETAELPEVEEELPLEEIELAMPVYTADELIQKAYAEGKDPTIIEDETTGITLVDFSDCL